MARERGACQRAKSMLQTFLPPVVLHYVKVTTESAPSPASPRATAPKSAMLLSALHVAKSLADGLAASAIARKAKPSCSQEPSYRNSGNIPKSGFLFSRSPVDLFFKRAAAAAARSAAPEPEPIAL
eukprot:4887251-Pleurochrysis_carterae.AAC.2